MSKMAASSRCWAAGDRASALTPVLRGLSPAQFRQLLDDDRLAVADEEVAMELALLFIQGRGDPALGRESGGALAPEDVDEVLLAVRWRLVPGPIIAERVMAHPALVDDQMQIRPRLLCALADGMRFQLLGGKAWSTMAPSRAGRLRRAHRIPIKSFSSLAVGMAVRVIDDLSQLRQLCKRCAPGAKKLDWLGYRYEKSGWFHLHSDGIGWPVLRCSDPRRRPTLGPPLRRPAVVRVPPSDVMKARCLSNCIQSLRVVSAARERPSTIGSTTASVLWLLSSLAFFLSLLLVVVYGVYKRVYVWQFGPQGVYTA